MRQKMTLESICPELGGTQQSTEHAGRFLSSGSMAEKKGKPAFFAEKPGLFVKKEKTSSR